MIKETIKDSIIEAINQFGFRGIFEINNNGQIDYQYQSGEYSKGKRFDINQVVPYMEATHLFIMISLIQQLETGTINFSEKIKKYLPELASSYDNVTIKDMILHQSGIQSYIGLLGLDDFEKKEKDKLSDLDFSILTSAHQCYAVYLNDVLNRLKDLDLQFPSGTKAWYSESNSLLLGIVLERVTHQTCQQYFEEHLFKPLGVTVYTNYKNEIQGYTRYLNSHEVYETTIVEQKGIYGLSGTLETMTKIIFGTLQCKLFTKKNLHWILDVNAEQEGMCMARNSKNVYSINTYQGGSYLSCTFDINRYIMTIFFTNEQLECMRIGPGIYRYFYSKMLRIINANYFIPNKLKLEPISERNGWDGLDLELLQSQEQFVGGPFEIYADALIYAKNVKQFVLTDSGVVIGLISLEVDKKHNEYYICNYMIDRNFQHRGYGKQGIKLAIEYLTKHGADKIQINFRDVNKVAQKTYESCGFKSVSCDWIVRMEYIVPKAN